MINSTVTTPDEVVGALLSLHRYLRAYAKKVSAELGISGRQLATLRLLHEARSCSVGQIAAHLFIADSTASELLDGLQERGFIIRTRLGDDNRVAMVALTPAGEELVQRAPLGGVGLLRQRLRSQSPETLAILAQALTLLGELIEIDGRHSC